MSQTLVSSKLLAKGLLDWGFSLVDVLFVDGKTLYQLASPLTKEETETLIKEIGKTLIKVTV